MYITCCASLRAREYQYRNACGPVLKDWVVSMATKLTYKRSSGKIPKKIPI